jgi:hypothetical protein
MWTNRRSEHGPFDIIGDVHGCFDELRELMMTLASDPKWVSASTSGPESEDTTQISLPTRFLRPD